MISHIITTKKRQKDIFVYSPIKVAAASRASSYAPVRTPARLQHSHALPSEMPRALIGPLRLWRSASRAVKPLAGTLQARTIACRRPERKDEGERRDKHVDETPGHVSSFGVPKMLYWQNRMYRPGKVFLPKHATNKRKYERDMSKRPQNVKDMMNFRFPMKECLQVHHFGKNATTWPHNN